MTNHKPNQHRRFKDLNWNAITEVFLIVVGAALGAVLVAVLLSSCQKESSFTAPKGVIENDSHLMPEPGWNYANRPAGYGAEKAGKGRGKGGGKPPKDTTTQEPPTEPQDTTYNPPPTYNGQGVILLDFDGQYVTGTAWNVNDGFYCKPANQTPDEQQQIIVRVQQDYSEFAVTVTSDSTIYWQAPANKRMRVIITESWEWYGQAGGVAYVGSFRWGNETPAFVFNSLLGYNTKWVADAASHEAGHTLNLRHQGKCDGTAYNPDLAADGKGYLMGYPYDKLSGWQVGVTPQCITQDDRAIIKANL